MFKVNKRANIYNSNDFRRWLLSKFSDWGTVSITKGRKQNRAVYTYYNIPAAFDIETSSFINNGEKHACLTCWQIGFNGDAWIGRTWDEFEDMINCVIQVLNLNSTTLMPVYVHNLGYEFQWLYKRYEFDYCFAVGSRAPAVAIYKGIEFRDSLVLSGASLANVGKNLLHKYKDVTKTDGWDYSLVRHSETPLTDDEIKYAISDVLVVMEYIQEAIELNGDVTKIPMTNTGYVRREVRAACMKDSSYMALIKGLTVTPTEYERLRLAYAGGHTHANSNKVGYIQTNVDSYDFTSSYPAVMIAEKYPMGKVKIPGLKTIEDVEAIMDNYCVMFRYHIKGLREALKQDHLISESRCIIEGHRVVDNGRVVEADVVHGYCTDVDWQMYKIFYDWDSVKIDCITTYYKAYLPTTLVDQVLRYYELKTTLKGVKGKELEYNLAKARLNSLYGMMVMSIDRDTYDALNEWKKVPTVFKLTVERYNKNKTRFLYYPWGVWITAYARRNLISGILAAGDSFIYSDTDSIKYSIDENPDFINYVSEFNDMVCEKMETAMKWHKFPLDRYRPKTIKGIEKPLGVWDFDGHYDEFKTLGAKRYMVRRGNTYETTVSGIRKDTLVRYLSELYSDPMEGFSSGLIIPATDSDKNALTYSDMSCKGVVIDYLRNRGKYEEKSYVYMCPCTASINISETFFKFLFGVYDLPVFD